MIKATKVFVGFVGFIVLVGILVGIVYGLVVGHTRRERFDELLPDVRACLVCVKAGLQPESYDEDERRCMCGQPIQRCRSVPLPNGTAERFCR